MGVGCGCATVSSVGDEGVKSTFGKFTAFFEMVEGVQVEGVVEVAEVSEGFWIYFGVGKSALEPWLKVGNLITGSEYH